jgi:hypothetical protein
MRWAKSTVLPLNFIWNQTYALASGGPWVSVVDDLAPSFQLLGQEGVAVPEPSMLMVGGAGALFGLGYAWRKRRAAA